MRLLIVIPHYFGPGPADSPNQSNRPDARHHRAQALTAVVTSLHQNFGRDIYGLDHERREMVRRRRSEPHLLDIVICTSEGRHLLGDLAPLRRLFRHHETRGDPRFLGFEGHKLLRDHRGGYDYYGYVEDDIVLADPMFFSKRKSFDRRFGPHALLQPNRYELAAGGAMQKLYVDWRIAERVTKSYQDIRDQPFLALPYGDETIQCERTPYPSAGCFFLNEEQLGLWVEGESFLDGDVSYMSPLDSAVTLSVMKQFRIYKPVLEQAGFLEVLHVSPRWIGWLNQRVALRSHQARTKPGRSPKAASGSSS
jgi:hypothetical protein